MAKNEKMSEIREFFSGHTYLDPTYDPAFKEFFGDEETLKSFLNGLLHLEGDNRIRRLTFKFEEEIRFRTPYPKNLTFDIFATSENGRFFDIEMQKANHAFFIDRAILYNAFLTIRAKQEMERSPEYMALGFDEQRKRRYELPDTVSIWICNFDLPETGGEAIDRWNVYSKNALRRGNAEPVSPKNSYIIVNLPRFTKSADKLERPEEKWLYLLKNAGSSEALPDFGHGIFDSALERIKVDYVKDDFLSVQEKAMIAQEEIDCRIAEGRIDARKEGREEGRAEGRAEGRKEGRAEGHKDGLADGISIFESLGVSRELLDKARQIAAEKQK